MELRKYFEILKRHALLIAVICLTASIATALITYIIPEKYEAKALVLVRPDSNISLTPTADSKELLSFPVGGASKAEVPSNTYIQIIKSRAIADKIVRLLRLDVERKVPATTFFQRFKQSLKKKVLEIQLAAMQILQYGRLMGPEPPFEAAVTRVQENITLTAIKDSYQFEIKYAASDPKTAADVANAAADLFLEYMTDLNTMDTKKSLEILDERLRSSGSELAAARQALRQFKERNEIVSFKEETAEEIKIISDLESSLEKSEVKLAGLLKEMTSANPKVQVVQAEKSRLETALRERQNQLRHLPEKERRLTSLNLTVQMADDIYQLIKKAHEEARVRARKSASETRVVSAAVPAFYPSRPLKYQYVGAGFLVSLLVGIIVALLLEYLNTTLRRIDDVEKLLQLRVLATIPQMGRQGDRESASRRQK